LHNVLLSPLPAIRIMTLAEFGIVIGAAWAVFDITLRLARYVEQRRDKGDES